MNQAMLGNTNAKRKLTADDVRLIRELHAHKKAEIERLNATLSIVALAEKFEVSAPTIEKILGHATWRHV